MRTEGASSAPKRAKVCSHGRSGATPSSGVAERNPWKADRLSPSLSSSCLIRPGWGGRSERNFSVPRALPGAKKRRKQASISDHGFRSARLRRVSLHPWLQTFGPIRGRGMSCVAEPPREPKWGYRSSRRLGPETDLTRPVRGSPRACRWKRLAGRGEEGRWTVKVAPLAGPLLASISPALLPHQAVADRQAQPGALADRLGGEERLEEPVEVLGLDAVAVVAAPRSTRHQSCRAACGRVSRGSGRSAMASRALSIRLTSTCCSACGHADGSRRSAASVAARCARAAMRWSKRDHLHGLSTTSFDRHSVCHCARRGWAKVGHLLDDLVDALDLLARACDGLGLAARSGLRCISCSRLSMLASGIGDLVGDAGGHLAQGHHLLVLDHGLLLAAGGRSSGGCGGSGGSGRRRWRRRLRVMRLVR